LELSHIEKVVDSLWSTPTPDSQVVKYTNLELKLNEKINQNLFDLIPAEHITG